MCHTQPESFLTRADMILCGGAPPNRPWTFSHSLGHFDPFAAVEERPLFACAAVAARYPLGRFPSNLSRRLVESEVEVNRLPQEPVFGPSQISDLGNELRLDPMHSRKNERRSEAGLAGGRRAERRTRAGKRLQTAAEIGQHLIRHARANTARINELAEERAEVGPGTLRVCPPEARSLLAPASLPLERLNEMARLAR